MDDANKEVIDLNESFYDGSGDKMELTDNDSDKDRAKMPPKKSSESKRKVHELQDSDS